SEHPRFLGGAAHRIREQGSRIWASGEVICWLSSAGEGSMTLACVTGSGNRAGCASRAGKWSRLRNWAVVGVSCLIVGVLHIHTSGCADRLRASGAARHASGLQASRLNGARVASYTPAMPDLNRLSAYD